MSLVWWIYDVNTLQSGDFLFKIRSNRLDANISVSCAINNPDAIVFSVALFDPTGTKELDLFNITYYKKAKKSNISQEYIIEMIEQLYIGNVMSCKEGLCLH